MRTTLNLDHDVLCRLRLESKRSGTSLGETVNHVLRLGLERIQSFEDRAAYRCPSFSMGFPPLSSPDRALQLAALVEDEELLRKLEMRK